MLTEFLFYYIQHSSAVIKIMNTSSLRRKAYNWHGYSNKQNTGETKAVT